MSVEKPSYENPEIQKRFEDEGYDWESIKQQLDKVAKQEEVDKKLNALIGNTEEYYNYLKELINSEQEESPEEGIDFSKLSKEKLEEMAERGVKGAQEFLDTQVEKGLNTVVSGFKGTVEKSWLGKILPKEFIDWIAETGKEKAQGKLEGFKGWLLGIVVGFIPGGKLLMDGYEKVFGDEETETPVDGSDQTGDHEDPAEGGDQKPTPALIEKERALNEVRDTMRMSGYRAIGKLSGLPQEGYETGIMGALDGQSHNLQSLQYKLDNDSKDTPLSELYGINEKYTDEQISKVVVMLIGPYNKEFFKYQLSPEKLKNLIGEPPHFTDFSKKYFTKEELEEISKGKYDYSSLSIGILSRLSILSVKEYINAAQELPGLFIGKLKNAFKGVLDDEKLQAMFSQEKGSQIPIGISLLFKDISTEKVGLNPQMSFFEDIANGKSELTLSDADQIFLEKLLSFREKLLTSADKYSLGLNGFSEDINNGLTWQNLLSLYIITEGKNLGSVEGFGKMMVYAWMHSSLSDGLQGNYETKILETLAEGESSDSLVLQAVAFQILELDRNEFYSMIKKSKGRIDGAVEYIVPGIENIENEWVKWIAINLIETGSLILAIKFLGRMPITKAVLIATSGIIGSLIYIGIAESLHKNTQSEIGSTYKKFIEGIAPRIGYENANTLIDGVNSGKISMWDIISNISPEQMAGEELGKIFFDYFGE